MLLRTYHYFRSIPRWHRCFGSGKIGPFRRGQYATDRPLSRSGCVRIDHFYNWLILLIYLEIYPFLSMLNSKPTCMYYNHVTCLTTLARQNSTMAMMSFVMRQSLIFLVDFPIFSADLPIFSANFLSFNHCELRIGAPLILFLKIPA